MDVGIFVLRVLVGLTVAAHGAQKLFGIFDGHGISGTAQVIESLGFRQARFFAYLLGIGEFAGGSLFAMGLFTPVAAMAIIAIMAAASAAVHWKSGFFATKGGFELPFVIAAAASSVAVAGPGSYSWDALLGLPVVGTSIALGAVVLGVVVGLAVVGIRNLPDKVPFRKPQTHS